MPTDLVQPAVAGCRLGDGLTPIRGSHHHGPAQQLRVVSVETSHEKKIRANPDTGSNRHLQQPLRPQRKVTHLCSQFVLLYLHQMMRCRDVFKCTTVLNEVKGASII